MAAGAVRRVGGDLLVGIRLTPRAAHDRLEGAEIQADGRVLLKARVRAVPESGKANAALIRLLSEMLAVPLRRLEIASGATARIKTVRIREADALLERKLEMLVRQNG